MMAPIEVTGGALVSGNQAIARGVWEAGVTVAAAYPGTPSTEILEFLAAYPEVNGHWAPNEKVALEVAIGASLMGARAFCAMKHVGLNVASDALMSQSLAGVAGGLVIAVADDVGLSSSQNEQDSRFWGRFAHLPVLEPADSQEAYEMALAGFELSERFGCPVLLRLTTRVCHVKTQARFGQRHDHPATGFIGDPARWVLIPAHARGRLGRQQQRDRDLAAFAETCGLNRERDGADRGVGFVTSGPAYLHVRESFPEAPVFKLGLSHPLPMERLRAFADGVETLVVVEETEPLIETELRAAGIPAHGKDLLPRNGELTPDILRPVGRRLRGETGDDQPPAMAEVFPRPPTMCVGCPHLGVYYCLSRFKNKAIIAGDIGCYTLGAGHPWQALDSCTCMGASIGMALGMDLGRGEEDCDKAVIAVIGDSTFLHMGIQGLLDLVYMGGNVTVMLLDNRTTGMTGGQDNAASGRGLAGDPAPKVDFAQLVQVLGVRPERVRRVDPYEMPSLFKTIREEVAQPEPSVIITNQPCVLIDDFRRHAPLAVDEAACTGCGNCLKVGCPAIQVTRRESWTGRNGRQFEKAWTRIDSAACTGCGLCAETCGPDVIVPYQPAAQGAELRR
jgi:indolepyruvate ferredoxin oxidoreductase alpha subunit